MGTSKTGWGLAAIVLLRVVLPGPASAQQSFDEWLKQDQAEFTAYNAEVTRQYNEFLEQERAAFETFLREAGAVWGEDNVWVPEKKTWVQYTENLQERSGVNFEDGVAEVEVIVEKGLAGDVLQAAVIAAVETLINSGTEGPIQMFRRRLFPRSSKPAARPRQPPALRARRYTVQKGDTLWGVSKRFKVDRTALARANGLDPDGWLRVGQELVIPGAGTPPPPAQTAGVIGGGSRPMLAGQVALADGTPVDRGNAAACAEEIVRTRKPKIRTIKGSDGKPRQAATVQFRLVPEHVRVRAQEFRPLVLKYSDHYQVYPPLVFAIIHTESAFNPRARSRVPAYGLMQLVPKSGARDAYRFVHKKDKLVSGDYLYRPDNNIELGCAFVHILDNRYLRHVNDPTSRMLCAIAAYNTGAGNVCRAFYDGTSVKRAAPIINNLDSGQVYAQLRSRLPYEETRNYIKKVRERMPLYKDWR